MRRIVTLLTMVTLWKFLDLAHTATTRVLDGSTRDGIATRDGIGARDGVATHGDRRVGLAAVGVVVVVRESRAGLVSDAAHYKRILP